MEDSQPDVIYVRSFTLYSALCEFYFRSMMFVVAYSLHHIRPTAVVCLSHGDAKVNEGYIFLLYALRTLWRTRVYINRRKDCIQYIYNTYFMLIILPRACFIYVMLCIEITDSHFLPLPSYPSLFSDPECSHVMLGLDIYRIRR